MNILVCSARVCGIYKITNTLTGKVYIGSSKNVARRLYLHRWELQRGSHHSVLMQRAWDKYGATAFFAELALICAEDDLLFYEQVFIDFYHAATPSRGMNISPVAGRVCVPFTPERSAAASALRKGKSIFLNNPEAYERLKASVRKGQDHPFFGKTHTVDAREKISAANVGRATWNKGLESAVKGVPRTDEVKSLIKNSVRACARTKLSQEKAREIRAIFSSGKTSKTKLANDYGVSTYAIWSVVKNLTWIEEAAES